MLTQQGNRLQYEYDGEQLWVEPWGGNSLRVRSTKQSAMPSEDWALLPAGGKAEIGIGPEGGRICNGKLEARVSPEGMLTFYNQQGKMLLQEYLRNHKNRTWEYCSPLDLDAREFKPIPGGDYALTVRFLSLDKNERLFGMGQYQYPDLDLKGMDLELAQRNSQASVPFCISNRGYGMLWNNPAVGRVTFGRNLTTWEARSTKAMDYWITAGDSPAEIEEAYAAVTGTVPMMPEFAAGFWQCKLRYQTQEELLGVAREYKRRGLPISVIVIDFFHWPLQGEWKFDPTYWPDPDAMIAELQEMGIQLMVSIWPTVDRRSENYEEMKERGYLIRTERGYNLSMDFQGNTVHFDATNPKARAYVWEKAKQNYYDKGIRVFWLDEAEPEYAAYDFDHYRYWLGPDLQVGNLYPMLYAKAFFDGMKAEGQTSILNLIRCAWAGSQRYGALLWSGDIRSSFESLRAQVSAGLNAGLAGIPWWTTDIGGFYGGNAEDPAFRELLVRWFEYGTFCPVMRLHGFREPLQPQYGTTGGAGCVSGAPNEVWSYGAEAYEILCRYLGYREKMKPYILDQMRLAHEKGTPVMRPVFYDFPHDAAAWETEGEFLFGPSLLVAPILELGTRERTVYLPEGAAWTNVWDGTVFSGGQAVTVSAPLEQIPLFRRQAIIGTTDK